MRLPLRPASGSPAAAERPLRVLAACSTLASAGGSRERNPVAEAHAGSVAGMRACGDEQRPALAESRNLLSHRNGHGVPHQLRAGGGSGSFRAPACRPQ
jgi:hypothetical protein